MCFHVGFNEKVDDLLRAERFCGFIGLTTDEGTDGGYRATVADDSPVIAPRRFQSPVDLGFVIGADARDLYCAVCEGVHSEFERRAAIDTGNGKGPEDGFCHGEFLLSIFGSVGFPRRRAAFRAGGRPAHHQAGSGGVSPCGIAGQELGQVQAGGFELFADEAESQKPAPEGVFRVVGFRPCGTG